MAQNLGIYAYNSNVKIKLKEDNTGMRVSQCLWRKEPRPKIMMSATVQSINKGVEAWSFPP